MKKLNLKKMFKILCNVLTIIAFAFIIKSLLSFDIDYSAYFNFKSLILTIISILITILVVYLVSVSWRILLELSSNKKLSSKEITEVYVKSNLGKYIPGNVLQFANRNILGTNLGISQTSIAMSTVLEIIVLCLASFFWSLILGGNLFFDLIKKYLGNINIYIIIFTLIILAILSVVAIIVVKKKFDNFFQEIKSLWSIKSLVAMTKSFLLLSLFFLVNALILTMIVSFSTPVDLSIFYAITIGYIISWLIGFITPGAPGGVGVRETVLTLIVSSSVDSGIILSAAVVQRLILIISDVALYIIVIIKNKKKEQDK